MLKKALEPKQDPIKSPTAGSGLRNRSSVLKRQESVSSSILLPNNSTILSPVMDQFGAFNENGHGLKTLDSAFLTRRTSNQRQKVTDCFKEKMANVSCLYADFTYKKAAKADFVESMKFERYRLMLQSQKEENAKLNRTVDECKEKLLQSEKEKETIMFAYRALETRINQEKQMVLMLQKSQKRYQSYEKSSSVSIGKIGKNSRNRVSPNNRGSKLNSEHQSADDDSSLMDENGVRVSTSDKKGGKGVTQNQGSLQDLISSKLFQEQLESKDGIKEWELRQKKMEDQKKLIQTLEHRNQTLVCEVKSLQKKIARLQGSLEEKCNKITKIQKSEDEARQQILIKTNELTRLQSDLYDIQTKNNNLQILVTDQEKDSENKKQIIEQLERAQYTYFAKEEREREEMETLRKFTENLQLSDQKISQFIKDNFHEKISPDACSQNKLYREDISYILHLVKKKEGLYSGLLKDYKDKVRETETRCFMLQKKVYLVETVIGKITTVVAETGSTVEGFNSCASPQLERIEGLLEAYALDKRLL